MEHAMRINDPSLWPDEIGDLRFVAQDETAEHDVVVVSEHGVTLALLFYRECCPIAAMCDDEDSGLPAADAWELVLAGDEIEVLERRLLVKPAGEESGTLTDDVIAWATLTILSRIAQRVPGRG
jgi:hypothetical protein